MSLHDVLHTHTNSLGPDTAPSQALPSRSRSTSVPTYTRKRSLSHKLGRITELAPEAVRLSRLKLPRLESAHRSYITENDQSTAEKLLQENRDKKLASKPHILRLGSKTKPWSQAEFLRLLEKLLLEDGPLGVMEYLLSNFKDVRSKDEESAISSKLKPNRPPPKDVNTLLGLASARKKLDFVYLFSKYAEQSGLDSALNVSMSQRDMDISRVLLANGADPMTQEKHLIKAINSSDVTVIALLCNAQKAIVPKFLDTALEMAILRGSLKSVIILLKAGASGSSITCLKQAISLNRPDIMAAMILSREAPTPECLDHVFDLAFQDSNSRDLMEIMLLGGASGNHVNQALVEATKLNDQETERLLVQYGASVNYNSGEAVIAAIEQNSHTSIEILLVGTITPHVASHILSRLPDIGQSLSTQERESLVSTFIERGANSESLGAILTSAIRSGHREMIIYLITHRASVNYRDGEALRLAICAADPTIFDLLLQCEPSQASFDRCMLFLFSLSHADVTPERQLALVSRLLAIGASGAEVNEALLRISAWDPSPIKNKLIRLFISYKADVNYKEGSCFGLAAEVADTEAIRLLDYGHPTALSLSRGILPAVHLTEERHRTLEYLISIGACGPATDEAFLILVKEETLDLPLIAKILGDGLADPNVGDAYALDRAVDEQNLTLLQLLADARPKAESLNKVFPKAMSILEKSTQYETCRILLEAGANGVVVASALLDTQLTRAVNEELFMLLIKHGADLNYKGFKALRRALANDDLEEFELLLSGPASRRLWSSTVCACFDILTESHSTNHCPFAARLVDAIKYHSLEFQYAVLGRIFTKAILQKAPTEFLNVLLSGAVDINYQNLPLQYAIEVDSEEVFDLITSYKTIRPTPRTVDLAFKKTWALTDKYARVRYIDRTLDLVIEPAPCSEDHSLDESLIAATTETPATPELVKSLIKHGASVHSSNNRAFINAATHGEVKVLELLLHHAKDPTSAALTLEHILSSKNWISDRGYAIAKALLSKGVPSDLLDEALSQVSEYNHAETVRTASFVSLLLQHGADPNCNHGQALQAAISRADIDAIKPFLLSDRLTEENLSSAFVKIIDGTHDESSAIAMMEVFLQSFKPIRRITTPDFLEPVIFTALKLWPQSTRVVDMLLDSVARPDSTVPFVIDEEQGVEQVSLLLWALLETQVDVSQEVIECLLEHGAFANYQTSKTRTTPLLVAAAQKPTHVTLLLLQHGADASMTNHSNETPLFIAARTGDIELVHLLIAAPGTTLNDGSLHEAAKYMHPAITKLLLQSGHDANYPSLNHYGRMALAEMCLRASATPSKSSSMLRFSETLRNLLDFGADMRFKNQGKPLVFQALDNKLASVDILRILIKNGLWKILNQEHCMYSLDGYVYSATTYIKRNLHQSPKENTFALLEILSYAGCQDVYYFEHPDGVTPQPEDMIGAPTEVLEMEHKLRLQQERLLHEHHHHHHHDAKRESHHSGIMRRPSKSHSGQSLAGLFGLPSIGKTRERSNSVARRDSKRHSGQGETHQNGGGNHNGHKRTTPNRMILTDSSTDVSREELDESGESAITEPSEYHSKHVHSKSSEFNIRQIFGLD